MGGGSSATSHAARPMPQVPITRLIRMHTAQIGFDCLARWDPTALGPGAALDVRNNGRVGTAAYPTVGHAYGGGPASSMLARAPHHCPRSLIDAANVERAPHLIALGQVDIDSFAVERLQHWSAGARHLQRFDHSCHTQEPKRTTPSDHQVHSKVSLRRAVNAVQRCGVGVCSSRPSRVWRSGTTRSSLRTWRWRLLKSP